MPKCLPAIALLGLICVAAGCASGRPAFTVEMNGRKVEFETFESGRIPRGNEVTRFDRQSIQILGEVPVEVNGVGVLISSEAYTVGGRRISVEGDARVVVKKSGEIQVSLQAAAVAAPAVPAEGTTSR